MVNSEELIGQERNDEKRLLAGHHSCTDCDDIYAETHEEMCARSDVIIQPVIDQLGYCKQE